jgi:hypothetical protein
LASGNFGDLSAMATTKQRYAAQENVKKHEEQTPKLGI